MEPADLGLDAKADAVALACEKRDLERLRQLASSQHGLVKDELRRVACGSTLWLIVTLSILTLHHQGLLCWEVTASRTRSVQT